MKSSIISLFLIMHRKSSKKSCWWNLITRECTRWINGLSAKLSLPPKPS